MVLPVQLETNKNFSATPELFAIEASATDLVCQRPLGELPGAQCATILHPVRQRVLQHLREADAVLSVS